MPTITVRPKKGLQVPDPVLKDMLPPEGRLVERSIYWDRRIRDEEVEIVLVKTTKPKTAKSEE